jgi:chromosome segregation and condensation protein ScpB
MPRDQKSFWEDELMQAASNLKNARADYVEAIVSAATIGLTQRDIASAVGKSYSSIQVILRNAGVTYEHRAVVPPL